MSILPAHTAPLEAVLRTEELVRRAGNDPDSRAEARAMDGLARELAARPQNVLRKLSSLVRKHCRAGSAGVSLLETVPGEDEPSEVFRWRAVSGLLKDREGATLPRHRSPSSVAIEQEGAVLFDRPARHFTALAGSAFPPIVEALVVPLRSGGRAVGSVWAFGHTDDVRFSARDARLMENMSRFAAAGLHLVRSLDALTDGLNELEWRIRDRTRELSRANRALRQEVAERERVEAALALEIADYVRLQEISCRLIPAHDASSFHHELVAAAIALTGADSGTLQALDEETGELVLLESEGVGAPLAERFERTRPDDATTCAMALNREERVVVGDFATDDRTAGTEAEAIHRECGIRAAQSTPLITRSGRLLGMLSTHWERPHVPSSRELRLFDILARQAADLVERSLSERALRRREHHLEELSRSLERRVAERTAELERQARGLRDLAGRLVSAEHRERKRLASLLHDDLQQLLVAARMRLSAAPSSDDPASLGSALQLIDEALDASRNLTRELRPPVLYEDGLVATLRWLVTDMAERHDLEVQLETNGEEPSVIDDVKALLFECVRELLFNVVKHARTAHAVLRLREEEDRLRVEVEDAGAGMTNAGDGTKSGMGLQRISERLEALDGTVEVESEPGCGTRVVLLLPLYHAIEGTPRRRAGDAAPPPNAADVGPQAAKLEPIRVVVADDHSVVRQGVTRVLSEDPRFVVVAEASDGIEAIEAVARHRPDVVLMDLHMPRMNGLEATRTICRRWPDTAVVGLSVHHDEPTRISMTNAGAAALLPKSGDTGAILGTILGVAPAGRT